MTPLLTVAFPTFHEPANAVNTAHSIRETTDADVEIVCVDDGSQDLPVEFPDYLRVKLFKTSTRIGSPAARHLAAVRANGTHILQCDCHCRFDKGWYEALTEMAFRGDRYKTVHCARMIALDRDHPTLSNNNGVYSGAEFNFCKNGKSLEAVWSPEKPGDDYELSAVMGSAYSYNRHWYLKLNPHRYLRSFGNEEESLSLKCWLAGGEIRLLKTVRVGHIFRTAKDRVPYVIRHSSLFYNRLFLIKTCLPEDQQARFINAIQPKDIQFHKAMAMIEDDAHLIELARVENSLLFTQSFESFCKRFGL